MATLTPRKIIEDGLDGSLATCSAGGDEFANTGVEFIRVTNDHASAGYTVTITAQTTSYYLPRYGKLTKSNVSDAVTAGNTIFLGPFRPSVWNDANGRVQITYKKTSDSSTITGSHLLKVEILYLEQK